MMTTVFLLFKQSEVGIGKYNNNGSLKFYMLITLYVYLGQKNARPSA